METLLSNCSSGVSSNILWSSYLSNDQFDLTESIFDKDFGISDLFPIELPGSLHYDIKKLESCESLSQSDISVTSDIEYDLPKVEIKNSDCMWSGLGSNSNIINNNNSNLYNRNNKQQQQHNNNNNEYQNYINTTNLSMQNIPPGQSLLINSRLNQNQQNKKLQQLPNQQQQQNTTTTTSSSSNFYYNKLIPTLMASDFIKDREQLICNNTRPDTPISLDDDAPEFKHSVDLAACIMGSNNISLNGNNINNCNSISTNTDQMIINKLKEHLEDTSTKNIDLRQIIPFVGNNIKKRSLTEVLNVIGSDDNDEYNNDSSCDDDNNCSESEYEDIIGGVLNLSNCNSIGSSSSISSNSSSSSSSSSNSSINGNISNSCSIYQSPTRQINNNIINNNNNYPMMHSDHSYTRSKDGVEDCIVDVYGSILETPSDSDEEIDVVSVGDKKLPTNPSDKDRRALQTKVAHKISARIVKTANGIRTIPPRRRDSYEPYNNINNNNTQTGGTITPNQIKSLGNSRYPTPAPTPYPIYNTNNVTSLKNTANSNGSRKRNSAAAAAARDEYLPTNKRHRGKKYQQQQKSSSGSTNHNNNNNNNNNNQTKKNNSDLEEADTIEKRNLHNDMERQRRIGLKNLFEALKTEIPSIKDKERAPKVNILREAAKLCDQLNRDDKSMNNMKQKLLNQLQRREQLLITLKAAQCKNEI